MAAEEAAASGVNWTFAPMVDISATRAGAALLKAPVKILI